MNTKNEHCIEDCLDCYRVCLETKKYCLEKGGKHIELDHITALSDCADLCQISVHFMIRDSDLQTEICSVCAESCTRCAESCEKFPDNMQMEKCAQICRMCARSCTEMSNA